MGTDIYLYAEIKKNNGWHHLGGVEENPEYYPEDEPNAQLLKPVEFYSTRNYNLFGILADVRNPNGRTFDNQKFEVISPPRGLPKDLSPEIQNWLKDWEWEDDEESDVSSPSWLLLSELLQFDWHNKVMRYEAMVDARVAHLFEDEKPFPYRQWPEGIEISYSQYHRDGVTVRWASTYAESVGKDFMDLLNDLRQHGEPSQIRLVFWFGH